MARAISRIFSVPWSAARTCLTSRNATTRASTQTAMTANRARVSPEPKSTSALASCASSRTGLISPPRHPSAGALDQARCPGRGPGRFERKESNAGPGPAGSRAPSREPPVPRAREDWAAHSHGCENRPTRDRVADASSQGRWQVGVGAAHAQPSGGEGVAAQPEAGPVAAVLEGRGLEVVDQGPDQGQAELAVVDLRIIGTAAVLGGGQGAVADLDPEAVGPLHQVDLDRVAAAGPGQVADGHRAGLGDGHLQVLDALGAHPRLAGHDADDQADRAQQPRLRREGQAHGGRPEAGDGIHGRGYSAGAEEIASLTELWIGNTLVRPVMRKILRIFSWVQTSWSEPSWLRTRFRPPTSTPSPVESRKSTFSRSTMMLCEPSLTSSISFSRSFGAV